MVSAIGRRLTAVLFATLLIGCSSLPRTPYTELDAERSRVLNLDQLRRYTDEPVSRFLDASRRQPKALSINYLALSGGGADGAYGAGFLKGWTVSGTRPQFTVVSGVSTGALIAPFAFLGSDYDDVLQEVYTSGIAERLVDSPNFLHVLFGAGLFGNTRLRELVARYVGQEALAAVAEESAKGRRLLVATTDLDTQRTAIWDMGRIAEVGTAEALSLFRDVMAASASIPLVFPPILISAKADGKEFQEMHVDGGVTAPILTLPDAFLLEGRSLPAGHRLNIYLLLNNKLERDFELVPNSTIDVASRAISSVTKSQTRSIVFSTYEFARRNRLDFHLTFIDRKIPSPSSPGFDTT